MYNAEDTAKITQRERAFSDMAQLRKRENSLLGPEISNAHRNDKSGEVFEPPCPVLTDGDNKLNLLTGSAANVQYQRKTSLKYSEHGNSENYGESIGQIRQDDKPRSYGQIQNKSALSINVSNNNPNNANRTFGQDPVSSVPKKDFLGDCRFDLHDAVTTLPKQSYTRMSAFSAEDIELPMILDRSLNILDQTNECVDEFDVYTENTFSYHRQAEQKYLPKTNYMSKQTAITFNKRSILIDWLVSVAEEYELERQTLFLSVNYIDRFLSKMFVTKGKLQLVGTACIFIAAKYEEVSPPKPGEFLYISDYTYTQGQLLTMELLILKALCYNLTVPTINTFLEHYIRVANLNSSDHKYLSMYLTELALLDAEPYLQFLPSITAAAAFFLAAETLELEDSWPRALADYSGYTVIEFYTCVNQLYKTHRNAENNPQYSIYQKYQKTKYQAASAINPLTE